jgi:DNA adenine methylase
MRTPITYYGGKQRIAPQIISMMPYHKIYVEPFFGGGAVFFRKPKAGIEVINDHDDRLINFYLCAQNRFSELQKLISRTLHSETMYRHTKDVWNGRVEAGDIEKAWAIWLITNGSFSGSMHGGWKWCNGTSGSHSGNYIKGKRADFTERLHQRLDNVQISSRDALRVIPDRDTTDTFPSPANHKRKVHPVKLLVRFTEGVRRQKRMELPGD